MRAYVRIARWLILLPLITTMCTWPETNRLPGRATSTPGRTTPPVLPTAPSTPPVTSPFIFPTSPASAAQDCTRIFPLDNVESIQFGVTTITQLEASFGRAQVQSGRAPRFRFEEGGCVLIVTIGVDEALDAELLDYGTLDLLLDRYGEPAAVGISQGNLVLLNVGSAVLLYPEQGITAIFDAAPDDLTRATPIASLQFRPPYAADQQIRRLKLRPVDDWMPP